MPVSELDEVTINLKVLASLEPSKKVITRDTYLNVEPRAIVPEWARRWWRGDDRNETLKKIDTVIENALRIRSVDESREVIDPYLRDSVKGLTNLKSTYTQCVQTCARIDTIIAKINRVISTEEATIKITLDE